MHLLQDYTSMPQHLQSTSDETLQVKAMNHLAHLLLPATLGGMFWLLAMPLYAWQTLPPTTSLRIGLGHSSENMFWTGRYTGVNERGFFIDAGFLLSARDEYDADKARYWRLQGQNLGLSARSLQFEAGEQGLFNIFFYYRELPNYLHAGVGTPYQQSGQNTLMLPAEGGKSQSNAYMSDVHLHTQREQIKTGLGYHIDTRWRFNTAVFHERKTGIKAHGFGDSWLNERAMLLPAPINYETTRFSTALSFDGTRVHTRLAYELSMFYQSHDAMLSFANVHASRWDNLALQTVSLEPNNQFHQLSASLGYTFADNGRINADLAIGRMQQDQHFIEDIPTLPSSLDGQVDTTVLHLRVAQRVLPRLNLRASYRFDERDNQTPVWMIDGRMTHPASYRDQRLQAEADYRLYDRTHLIFALRQNAKKRTYADRYRTDETAYETRLRTQIIPMTTFSTSLVMARQRGSQWERQSGPAALRKYYLADRDRVQATALIGINPIDRLQITMRREWIEDDYLRSELGLTSAQRDLFGIDVSFVPTDRITSFAFYAYEQRKGEQTGMHHLSPWQAKREDQFLSLGLGMEYVWQPEKLSLGAEWVFMETAGRNYVYEAQSIEAYPILKSHLQQMSLYGNYHLRKNIDLRLRYMFEQYRESDWGIYEGGMRGVGDLILLDQSNPNYAAHLVAATLLYRF